VFRAITEPNGLTGWWATTASGTCKVGEKLDLGFGGVITLSFVVREIVPDKLLRLICPHGPGPWANSDLSFQIDADEEQTFVTLVHESEQATDDDFLYFNTKWPIYLLSLRDFVETGTGRPSPKDIPIHVGDTVTSNTE
jgi:uncharacterized protein YndB with AHSA1/START domain